MQQFLQRAALGIADFFSSTTGGAAAVSRVAQNVKTGTDDFVSVMSKELGADSGVLRNSLDEAYDVTNFRANLDAKRTGAALSDEEFSRIAKAREHFLTRQKEGNYDTLGSYKDIAKNLNETGEIFSGYSRAGQTRSVSALSALFDSNINQTMGQEIGMLATAGLIGGGMNYAAGGEFGTGAGVGALAAVGIRGAGRLIQESMPEIETSMMKRLLGETEYGKLKPIKGSAAQAQETVKSKYGGRNMIHLYTDQPNLKLSDLGIDHTPYASKGIDASSTLDVVAKKLDLAEAKKFAGIKVNSLTNDPILTQAAPAQPAQSVRTQALNTIKGMSPDQVKNAGVGSSYMQKLLTDPKRGNVGTNMRVMTLSGAALAGVPFTGRRNDHSSGFNKNRGNKI